MTVLFPFDLDSMFELTDLTSAFVAVRLYRVKREAEILGSN